VQTGEGTERGQYKKVGVETEELGGVLSLGARHSAILAAAWWLEL